MTRSTILVVDDERTLARSIKAYLADYDYDVEVAGDAEQALELLERVRPDVVFADVRLPGMSGITLLQRIRAFDPALPVIIMTAYGTIAGAVEAVKLGAFDYLKKPIDLDELRLLADRAREGSRVREELSYYRERAGGRRGAGRRGGGSSAAGPFAGIMGTSSALRLVMDKVQQIAALDETPPVLITGETGTGKGLIARTLHASGPRASKPFIEINCTALPANLMEAELFGYERGAFTDAKESKVGLFEAAEGGFLFLDEVGDIELSVQGKLLRAIEDRTVRRVGGIRDRTINTRILAATNRDLERAAQQGQFRNDLYFRLAVILLRLPPLRDRGDDVLILAEHFARQFSGKYGKSVRTISGSAREALMAYPWPGNVRELSHVIERAVLWSRGDTLEADQLSLSTPPAHTSPPRVSIPAEGGDLPQWERAMIEEALRDTGGNQTKAAQRLGITRDTLRYRLKKFGIKDDGERSPASG
jgi:two-component system, NtrC family, response regulator AtoC